jgi:hypothetical protein
MPKVQIPFAMSSSETREKHEGAARLINCYVEATPGGEAGCSAIQ